jgi:hypothetical protein
MKGIERRASPGEHERSTVTGVVSTRAVGGKKFVTGFIPYRSWSQDLGGFTEQIAPGAFRRALDGTDAVTCLWSHDDSKPLASTNGKTLTLNDSPAGLRFDVELRNTQAMDDVFQAVHRGDAPDVSFGFQVIRDSWAGKSRTLLEVKLSEITIGLWKGLGAYPEASAQGDIRARQALRAAQTAKLEELRKSYGLTMLDDQPAMLARAEAALEYSRESARANETQREKLDRAKSEVDYARQSAAKHD